MSNPYHSDPVLNWLRSQFAEGIVTPSGHAENAFHEIVLLRDLADRTQELLAAMDGTEHTQPIAEALEKYKRWKR